MLSQKALEACGFSQTEQQILEFLLEHEGISAGGIAKRLGLKRSTVYSALGSLEQIGILAKGLEAKVTTYTAVSPGLIPKILRDLARDRFNRVNQAAAVLERELRDYLPNRRRRIGGYEIVASESKEAAYNMLYTALTGGDFCGIFDIDTATQGRAGRVVEEFLAETSRTRHRIRDIVVTGKRLAWYRARIKNPFHEVKEISREYSIMTDFILTDGCVYLTNYQPGQEMLIKIRQPDYYRSMLNVFELLWKMLPEGRGQKGAA